MGLPALPHLPHRRLDGRRGARDPALLRHGAVLVLRPEDGRLRYSTPEGDWAYPLDVVLSPGFFRSPRRALAGSGGAGQVFVSIVPQECSDGMSDRHYGLDATLVFVDDEGSRMLTGCCSISE